MRLPIAVRLLIPSNGSKPQLKHIYRPLDAACKPLKTLIDGLTQLRWQHAKVLLKAAAEMAGIVKAALLRNL